MSTLQKLNKIYRKEYKLKNLEAKCGISPYEVLVKEALEVPK